MPSAPRRPRRAASSSGQPGDPANLDNQLGGHAKGNAAMAARADKRAADLLPLILPMKAGGASLRQIADGLNRCGVPAPRGGDWSAIATIAANVDDIGATSSTPWRVMSWEPRAD